MKSFLIVYNTRTGTLVDMRSFDAGDEEEALRERFAEEAAKNDDGDIEIVVLRAESEHAIRESHARYFSTSEELLDTAGRAMRRQDRNAISHTGTTEG